MLLLTLSVRVRTRNVSNSKRTSENEKINFMSRFSLNAVTLSVCQLQRSKKRTPTVSAKKRNDQKVRSQKANRNASAERIKNVLRIMEFDLKHFLQFATNHNNNNNNDSRWERWCHCVSLYMHACSVCVLCFIVIISFSFLFLFSQHGAAIV